MADQHHAIATPPGEATVRTPFSASEVEARAAETAAERAAVAETLARTVRVAPESPHPLIKPPPAYEIELARAPTDAELVELATALDAIVTRAGA